MWYSLINMLLPTLFYPAATLPFLCFNLYRQSFASFSSLSSCQTATWSIKSHVNAKFLILFVARVVQEVYCGNGPFSHILCSFVRAIRRYIDRPERSRRNKMFQILVWGLSIESCVTTLIEAARTPPSLTRRQTKVDFCNGQVPFYKNGRKFGLNLPWLKRTGS